MSMMVFFSANQSQVYTDDMLIIDDLLPGFELTVKQLFTEAELI
ncbi:MAG: hypothetical protein RLZZ507_3688 [Cyanobacteriota bacterium]|jgi:Uma2 family endonuclease